MCITTRLERSMFMSTVTWMLRAAQLDPTLVAPGEQGNLYTVLLLTRG